MNDLCKFKNVLATLRVNAAQILQLTDSFVTEKQPYIRLKQG